MFKKCGVCIGVVALTIALLSACDSSQDKNREAAVKPVVPVSAPSEATQTSQQAPETTPTVSAPAPQAAEPASAADAAAEQASTGADTALEASQFINYICNSGKTLAAAYSNEGNWAIVRYQDQQYKMVIAISASGARYTAEDMEWWTKDSSGTLTKLGKGQEGELLESCTQAE